MEAQQNTPESRVWPSGSQVKTSVISFMRQSGWATGHLVKHHSGVSGPGGVASDSVDCVKQVVLPSVGGPPPLLKACVEQEAVEGNSLSAVFELGHQLPPAFGLGPTGTCTVGSPASPAC